MLKIMKVFYSKVCITIANLFCLFCHFNNNRNAYLHFFKRKFCSKKITTFFCLSLCKTFESVFHGLGANAMEKKVCNERDKNHKMCLNCSTKALIHPCLENGRVLID